MFNVRSTAYAGGAQANPAVNDALAFKECLAAADAAGGTMFVPAGTYLIELGDPATDSLWSDAIGGNSERAFLRIEHSNTGILCEPGAHIRVVATYVPQATSAYVTALQSLIFFGHGSAGTTKVEHNWLIGGLWTFETGGTASLLQGPDTHNGFRFARGYYVRGGWQDLVIDGFPSVGEESGTIVDTVGMQRSFNTYRNVQVLNYGGGGRDLCRYLQGGVTYEGGSIKSTRTYQSHGIYFGLKRPDITITNVEFEGVRWDRPIDFRGGDQDNPATKGEGMLVEGCTFRNCTSSNHGYTGSAYNRGTWYGNHFENTDSTIPAGGVTVVNTAGARFAANTFKGPYVRLLLGFGADGAVVAHSNVFRDGAHLQCASTATNCSISGQYLNAKGTHPINISTTGTGNQVLGPEITVDVATAGSFYAILVSNVPDLYVAAPMIRVTNHTAVLLYWGLRIDAASKQVRVRGGLFESDSTSQQWRSVDVSLNVSGPVLIRGVEERRPGGVLLSTTNGPYLPKEPTIVLDSEFASRPSSVSGVVRGEGNTFAGLTDRLNVGTVTTAQTPNAGPYRVIAYTLGASLLINNPDKPYPGARLELDLKQDSVGGRVVTWGSEYVVSWTPDTSPNKRNVITLQRIGAEWVQIAAATGL